MKPDFPHRAGKFRPDPVRRLRILRRYRDRVNLQLTPDQSHSSPTRGRRDRRRQSRLTRKRSDICGAGRRIFRAWPSTARGRRLGRDSDAGGLSSFAGFPTSCRLPGPCFVPGFVPDADLAGGQLSRVRRHESLLAAPRSQLEHEPSPDASAPTSAPAP